MPENSANLSLPYLQPAQAQKHVTHNEALLRLDALVQPAVLDRDRTEPPESPAEGDRHIVAAAATGAWSGQDGRIALWDGGAWLFLAPRKGWQIHVLAETLQLIHDGADWQMFSSVPESLDRLGIAATPDAANRLSVAAPAVLLSHDGAGHQLKINKAAAAETGSLLFQTGFSGRAEMGLAGSDDWALKVSADGSSWTTALSLAAATGLAGGAAVQDGPADTTAGRLMTVGAFGLGALAPEALPDLDDGQLPTGFHVVESTTAGTWPDGATAPARVRVERLGDGLAQEWQSAGSGAIHHRRHDGSAWSGWSLALTGETLVGQVSQESGQPTGAAFEQGDGTGGDYLRLASGLQICWSAVSLSYNGSASCRADWTFPVAFTAAPRVVAMANVAATSVTPSLDELGPICWGNSGTNTTVARLICYRNGSTGFASGDTIAAYAVAFGTWV